MRPDLKPGARARKIGGSYQATGTLKAVFAARDGSPRVVFEFDQPPGLLHIFAGEQIAVLTEPPPLEVLPVIGADPDTADRRIGGWEAA